MLIFEGLRAFRLRHLTFGESMNHRPHENANDASESMAPAALFARMLLALALFAGLGGAFWFALLHEPRALPIRGVTVAGELRSLSRQELQEAVASHLRGGILTQDLHALRREIEALPWVRSASLRRVWPDRLELHVEEQQAIARWGADGLVTHAGEVFRPRDGRVPAGLARLVGAADIDAPQVVERFLDWQPRLAALGLIIDELRRDARGDWSLTLLGGTELFFGTDAVEARFGRLLTVWPRLELIAGTPTRVDLRYSNGLALRWPTPSRPEQPARGRRVVAAPTG